MSWRKNSVPPSRDLFGLPTPSPPNGLQRRKLRIVASGTLFVTHTLHVPPSGSTHVGFMPGSDASEDALFAPVTMRAQSVTKSRGGSAATILSLLCQFGIIGAQGSRPRAEPQATYLRPTNTRESDVEAWLVAPIGRGSEASTLLGDLEKEGIKTKLCLRRDGEGVPCAYIVKTVVAIPPARPDSAERANPTKISNAKPQTRIKRTIINYNPIPDLTHDEFIRLLAPLLYPTSPVATPGSSSPINRSPTSPEGRFSSDEGVYFLSPDPPFDWLHFEGRTAQTTLSNMTGLDGFARERGWRGKMVFSLDCTRVGRQGQEALIPHADVIFFSKAYAKSLSYTSPRAFLLAQALRSAPHALLVVSWAEQGSALLSVPTREYLQSSAFITERDDGDIHEFESVRGSTVMGSVSVESGNGHNSFSTSTSSTPHTPNWGKDVKIRRRKGQFTSGGDGQARIDDEDDEDAITETADDYEDVVDENGADDAFVAGMIYALSRRLLPGTQYCPMGTKVTNVDPELEKGRWRLEECLRFATEMAGRKIRRKGFNGLAKAMENVGWFDDT